MTDTAASDRPLVTFALFAYNQEDYVREAIEGAFAQTYEPLEIILSDDCSADRTFEIMQEMAAEYRGPHRVRVRQNSFNVGTALHVQLAFNDSQGVLFVVAAGDDISAPSRVSTLVSVWDDAGRPSGAIHSGREVGRVGRSQALERLPAKRSGDLRNPLAEYAQGRWLPAAAPTCAYTRDVFERFGPLLGGSIIEDAPLLLRAVLIGELLSDDRPLVFQRMHENNSGTGHTITSPARWNRLVQSKIIAFRTMQIDLARAKECLDPDLYDRIERRVSAVLRSASGLLVSETAPQSSFEKLRLALRIVTAPAVAPSFKLRSGFALSFFGFRFHSKLKRKMTGGERRR